VCTAQALLHGLQPFFSIANVLGTALANGRSTARRSETPRSKSLGYFTGHTATHSPQPTHASLT